MTGNLKSVLAPFFEESNPRHGLPATAYTGSDFWNAECASVFQNNWICIGFIHELKEAGDVIPVSFANQQLLITKDESDNIAVFHNICRHRCLTLVDEPKNVGRIIRCPYHAWCYGLNGDLRVSPHFGGVDKHDTEGFHKEQHGLIPVRFHIWQDWIFVNLNAKALPFDEYAAPLIKRLEQIDWNNLQSVGMLDFGEVSCNWKFIMENFIEPYHVQFVHSTTTDQPLADHHTIMDGNCLGSEVNLDEETGVKGSLGVSSRYLTLYPNFIVGRYFPNQLGVYLNIPTAAGTMQQKRALYTTDGKELSNEEKDNLQVLWTKVHKEDHEMTERLQLGRRSPVADSGGLLSPVWEDSVRAFQELVARDVLAAEQVM